MTDGDGGEYVLYDEHEFAADIAALGLGAGAVAKFLHRDPRAVARWLTGEQDIAPAIGMLLRLMIITGWTPERTAALIGVNWHQGQERENT